MNRRVVLETIELSPNNALTKQENIRSWSTWINKGWHLRAHSRAAPITDGMILTGKLRAW